MRTQWNSVGKPDNGSPALGEMKPDRQLTAEPGQGVRITPHNAGDGAGGEYVNADMLGSVEYGQFRTAHAKTPSYLDDGRTSVRNRFRI